MYGHLLLIFQGYIKEKFQEETWQKICDKCDIKEPINPKAQYDEQLTEKCIQTATTVLGFQRDQFLRMAGEYYFEYAKKIGYDELLRNLGANMLQFIENLDYVHTYIMSEFPEVNMPSFRCESDSVKDRMTVHYYSFRKGLHFLAVGLLRAAAKSYFKSELAVDVISENDEDVSEREGGRRHHVVLSITVTEEGRRNSGPPTMIAQTKKNAEDHVNKGDIDRVLERLDEIRRLEGEDALPLKKKKTGKAKWKAIAKMSVLYGGFNPVYPRSLSFDAVSFCNAFPYHVAFNETMTVVHSGVTMQKLMPTIRNPGALMTTFYELLHPHSVDMTFDNIKKFIQTPFVLRTNKAKMMGNWGKKPMIILRGQMINIASTNVIVFLCSPFVRCLKDVEQRAMYLADIPIHDVTRDLLWMELMTRYHSKQDKKSPEVSASNAEVGITSPMQRLDPNDPDMMKAEIRKLQQQLEEQKQQNLILQTQMLPPTVATQIRDGQPYNLVLAKNATVLFVDLVSFASIINKCKPAEVVNLLTRMHSTYSRICVAHGVFRIEAVADAYLVVSGTPEPVKSHAERIANTALGMLMAVQDMTSSYTYNDGDNRVKIRIGVHSGPVLSGVIGDPFPRFLVFGETVTLAARMESHGVPNKIHISQDTHNLLKKKPFKMEKRGEVELRGKGRLSTHFLLSNTEATREQILGGISSRGGSAGDRLQPPSQPTSSTPSADRRSPRNKVSPLNAPDGGVQVSNAVSQIVYDDE